MAKEGIHGGDIYTNGIFKGVELLDYSSNINPLGVPDSFKNNISEALEKIEKYPDIKYREVTKALKEYLINSKEFYCIGKHAKYLEFTFTDDNFVLGNGAAEIIDMAISCFKSILIVVPSFAEYEIDAIRHNCKIEYSYLTESMDIDYGDIYSKLCNVEALIIGNPNNPNGRIIDKEQFKSIINYCEENSKVIIIDEAFIEFTGNYDYSFLEETKNSKCIFIIKALTKFFGMPGIRFGYGISINNELLNRIRCKQNPWNINCFAETAIKYVLKDKEYISSSLKWIKEEKEYINNELKNINFIDKVYDFYGNFVLCKLKGIDSDKLYDLCLKSGLLIRKAHNFRGLDKNYVRFAVKDRDRNKRFIEILRKFE